MKVRIRELLAGVFCFILANYIVQFFAATPDYKAASMVAFSQAVLALYFWHKLRNTLEF